MNECTSAKGKKKKILENQIQFLATIKVKIRMTVMVTGTVTGAWMSHRSMQWSCLHLEQCFPKKRKKNWKQQRWVNHQQQRKPTSQLFLTWPFFWSSPSLHVVNKTFHEKAEHSWFCVRRCSERQSFISTVPRPHLLFVSAAVSKCHPLIRTHDPLLHGQEDTKRRVIGSDCGLKTTQGANFTGALDVLLRHDGRIMTGTVQRTGGRGRRFVDSIGPEWRMCGLHNILMNVVSMWLELYCSGLKSHCVHVCNWAPSLYHDDDITS